MTIIDNELIVLVCGDRFKIEKLNLKEIRDQITALLWGWA